MINWITDDLVPNDKIFVLPGNLRIHTIHCIEEFYDRDRELRGLKVKSKNYYFWLKDKK